MGRDGCVNAALTMPLELLPYVSHADGSQTLFPQNDYRDPLIKQQGIFDKLWSFFHLALNLLQIRYGHAKPPSAYVPYPRHFRWMEVIRSATSSASRAHILSHKESHLY